jgi:hypothetical protein
MIKDKKVIVISIAGEKPTMECQFQYILKEKNVIDKFIIFANTQNQQSIEWFQELEKEYPNFIEIDFLPFGSNIGSWDSIGLFARNCTDPNTIYIRIDEDVVYFSENFFYNLANESYNNKNTFIVFPYIFNNTIMDYYIQNQGLYEDLPFFEYNTFCETTWRNGEVAIRKHEYVFNKVIGNNSFKIPNSIIETNYPRISVNCFSFKGGMGDWSGIVHGNEEEFFSINLPRSLGLPPLITNSCHCAHYAYHTQRDVLNSTTILKRYRELVSLV